MEITFHRVPDGGEDGRHLLLAQYNPVIQPGSFLQIILFSILQRTQVKPDIKG